MSKQQTYVNGRFSISSARQVIDRNGGFIGEKGIRFKRPGLKVLAAIDFLVNHCGYYWHKEQ